MIFKRALLTLVALVLLAPSSASAIERVMTDEHIQKLEQLHQEAETLIVTNDFDGAIKKYDEILMFEPDDETAYANLGNAYLILGNTTKAERAFLNALNINPDNEVARSGLTKIHDPDHPEIPELSNNLKIPKDDDL